MELWKRRAKCDKVPLLPMSHVSVSIGEDTSTAAAASTESSVLLREDEARSAEAKISLHEQEVKTRERQQNNEHKRTRIGREFRGN